ncbi:MAG: DegT/DnrJ/EryC1/StrS family aminotransferase [Candidatus Diapherotrites archaeon]|jgi:perosamine synthetase|nr:DegT/DnrJ/EryC1/StrS family aminotransferase [Candidatus Diapherotrites archaeon]MBT4596639.1 DegT/DnrJ/EryC1/StrS family aminotransferase [Candidatus Diapherotrites archaeon]
MEIPLCKTYMDEKELAAVKTVLDSGWLAHGPKNKELENQFKGYVGTKHASCFNSCASALLTAILAKDLKGEIILPSFTFTASANAIELAGCKPVFVDIDENTFNISLEEIEKNINDKTVAIMPVHYAGQICEMDKIMELANKHNLVVIEDSAETIGAKLNGKHAGSFGIGCFSFYPTKNITTGEGGLLTFNDDSIVAKVNAIKGHGIVKPTFDREEDVKAWYRDAVLPGYNFRMSDINAAIGVEQMKKLDEINALRQKHSLYLNKQLEEVVGDKLIVPKSNNIENHVYQMYVIKLNEANDRDALLKHLKDNKIGASVHFEPVVHQQTYFKQKYPITLKVTEDIQRRIITLPMFPGLKQEELDYMVLKIEEFFKK